MHSIILINKNSTNYSRLTSCSTQALLKFTKAIKFSYYLLQPENMQKWVVHTRAVDKPDPKSQNMYYIFKKILLTTDRMDSTFSLALDDLKTPMRQTGIVSPHIASKFDAVSKCICLSTDSVSGFLVWLEVAFLFFFSKPLSKVLSSWIAEFKSFTEIPVLNTCFSPFDIQPTIAGSASTPNFFTTLSEASWTYISMEMHLLHMKGRKKLDLFPTMKKGFFYSPRLSGSQKVLNFYSPRLSLDHREYKGRGKEWEGIQISSFVYSGKYKRKSNIMKFFLKIYVFSNSLFFTKRRQKRD